MHAYMHLRSNRVQYLSTGPHVGLRLRSTRVQEVGNGCNERMSVTDHKRCHVLRTTHRALKQGKI